MPVSVEKRIYDQKRYLLNAEAIKERSRAYRKAYPEKIKAHTKRYIEENKIVIKEKKRAYHKLHPEKQERRISDWRIKNPLGYRKATIKRKYGLSIEEYEALLKEQNNACAICSVTEFGGRGYPPIDHDHDTGKVRAILCNKCNAGLGLFRDNKDILMKAFAYLQKHGK